MKRLAAAQLEERMAKLEERIAKLEAYAEPPMFVREIGKPEEGCFPVGKIEVDAEYYAESVSRKITPPLRESL